MNIPEYLRLVRAHWLLILAFVAVCVGGAGLYAWLSGPVYAAETQLFVSTRTGGLFTGARVESYARIASSLDVAEAVSTKLGLSESPREVEEKITATVPVGTVLIDVTAEHESPELAQEIAEGVAEEFPRLVNSLESPAEVPPAKITVTDAAQLPTSPASPPVAVYLILGAVLGLLLGLGAAVLRETFDRRIRYGDIAQEIVDAPVVGRIAHDREARSRPLTVVDGPETVAAEDYRRLRTNLRVLTIDRGLRSLLVTSAVTGEGKTLVTANVGFAFAQAGHKVVLVDGDMRSAGLSNLLGFDLAPGLSEVLSGDVLTEPLREARELPVAVLTSGSPPPNPSELLDSDRFADLLARLTARADIVVLDSPALLPVTDAAVMARLTSAVVIVAQVSSTRADEFDMAADSLRAVGKQPIGSILNRVSANRREYAYARNASARNATTDSERRERSWG
jgi:succinoglycan biosynthesis transport protein ExoP